MDLPTAKRASIAGAWRTLAVLAGAVAIAALGCTPSQYAAQADKAAYGVIRQTQKLALGREDPFEITYEPFPVGADAANAEQMLLGGEPIPAGDAPPRVLSLAECMEIARRNSRSFQTRKERLYSSALALANLRHDWSGVFGSASADVGYERVRRGETTRSGTGATELSFAQKFATGGALTLAAGLDAATNFLGIDETSFGSLLEANLTQPLLQGAWRGFAYEELYRAERDFAYAVLEYERFMQTFSVDVAEDYYRVLQARDELRNEEDNLDRLRQQFKFNKAQEEQGIIRRVQVDQAEQRVLSSEAQIQRVRQNYHDALDEFKVTLGLPIIASIELDDEELKRLELRPIGLEEAQALSTAMRTRPDVLSEYAAARDARRDVEIAADRFNPRLDLTLDISATGTEPRKPFRTQFHRHRRFAGLTFEYAFDQTDNRDDYRRALIALCKAQRDLDEFLDTVRLEVRQSYRSLARTAQTYRIQTQAVKLAEGRARLAKLEQKDGFATTRDVLEAEDALKSSKNARTAALVNYATTRLRFLADLGMISVDEQGKIHERSEPFYLDRLRPEQR